MTPAHTGEWQDLIASTVKDPDVILAALERTLSGASTACTETKPLVPPRAFLKEPGRPALQGEKGALHRAARQLQKVEKLGRAMASDRLRRLDGLSRPASAASLRQRPRALTEELPPGLHTGVMEGGSSASQLRRLARPTTAPRRSCAGPTDGGSSASQPLWGLARPATAPRLRRPDAAAAAPPSSAGSPAAPGPDAQPAGGRRPSSAGRATLAAAGAGRRSSVAGRTVHAYSSPVLSKSPAGPPIIAAASPPSELLPKSPPLPCGEATPTPTSAGRPSRPSQKRCSQMEAAGRGSIRQQSQAGERAPSPAAPPSPTAAAELAEAAELRRRADRQLLLASAPPAALRAPAAMPEKPPAAAGLAALAASAEPAGAGQPAAESKAGALRRSMEVPSICRGLWGAKQDAAQHEEVWKAKAGALRRRLEVVSALGDFKKEGVAAVLERRGKRRTRPPGEIVVGAPEEEPGSVRQPSSQRNSRTPSSSRPSWASIGCRGPPSARQRDRSGTASPHSRRSKSPAAPWRLGEDNATGDVSSTAPWTVSPAGSTSVKAKPKRMLSKTVRASMLKLLVGAQTGATTRALMEDQGEYDIPSSSSDEDPSEGDISPTSLRRRSSAPWSATDAFQDRVLERRGQRLKAAAVASVPDADQETDKEAADADKADSDNKVLLGKLKRSATFAEEGEPANGESSSGLSRAVKKITFKDMAQRVGSVATKLTEKKEEELPVDRYSLQLVYKRFAVYNHELHKETLGTALEILNFRPVQQWIEEISESVTQYASLDFDEFVAFLKLYVRRRDLEHKALFEIADSDGSKTIDDNEITWVLRRLGIEPMPFVIKEIFNEVDVDGSGEIEYEEFEEFWTIIREREGFSKKEFNRFKLAFRIHDIDRSGAIDVEEACNCVRYINYSLSDSDIRSVFTKVDMNRTGQLNLREFLVFMRKVRELEISRIEGFIKREVDFSKVSAITKLLSFLGYFPDPNAIVEVAELANITLQERFSASQFVGKVLTEDSCQSQELSAVSTTMTMPVRASRRGNSIGDVALSPTSNESQATCTSEHEALSVPASAGEDEEALFAEEAVDSADEGVSSRWTQAALEDGESKESHLQRRRRDVAKGRSSSPPRRRSKKDNSFKPVLSVSEVWAFLETFRAREGLSEEEFRANEAAFAEFLGKGVSLEEADQQIPESLDVCGTRHDALDGVWKLQDKSCNGFPVWLKDDDREQYWLSRLPVSRWAFQRDLDFQMGSENCLVWSADEEVELPTKVAAWRLVEHQKLIVAWDVVVQEIDAELGVLQTERALRLLGWQVPHEFFKLLVNKMDINGSGKIDLKEFHKLVRALHERDIEQVRQACLQENVSINECAESIEKDQAERILMKLGATEEEMPHLMYLALAGTKDGRMTVHRLTCVASWRRSAERRIARQHHGFGRKVMRGLGPLWKREFRRDDAGCVSWQELMPLAKKDFMEENFGHDCMADMVQLGQAKNVVKLDLVGFLALLREACDKEEERRQAREIAVQQETGFTDDEVREFRQIFVTHDEDERDHLSFDVVKNFFGRLTEKSRTKHELNMELNSLWRGIVSTRRGRALTDFCDFLRLMKRLIDCDFGGLSGVSKERSPAPR